MPTSKIPTVDQHEEQHLERQRNTVGGSIIMPIDMVSVATIMIDDENGSTIRKPISKPRRSSES